MFTTDAAIHRASLIAAVASGRPRLRLIVNSEDAIADRLSELQASLGPLPQADIIEPSEPGDLDWELRVDLPELSSADALLLDESLLGTDRSWAAAPSEASTAASDAGLLLDDLLSGSIEAVCQSIADGGLVTPDLWRAPTTDPTLRSTEAALAVALASADPRLVLHGPEGLDGIQAAVHRPTGRAALELWFPSSVYEGLDGDAVRALRVTAMQAIASIVGQPEVVPLDPHLLWWPHLGGTTFVVFLATKPAVALHEDQAIRDSAEPAPRALAALIAEDGFCHNLELQLLEEDPQTAMQHLLDAGAVGAEGAAPRWVDAGGTPLFATTWRLPFGALSFLNNLPVAFRIVPGEPIGLDEEVRWTQKVTHWGSERVAVRLRDGAYDQDREPTTLPRPLTAADAELLPHLIRCLGDSPLGPESVIPVVGSDGRHGLRLDLPRACIAQAASILDALTHLSHPSIAAWIDVAFPRAAGLRIHVWARMQVNGVRTYVSLRAQ